MHSFEVLSMLGVLIVTKGGRVEWIRGEQPAFTSECVRDVEWAVTVLDLDGWRELKPLADEIASAIRREISSRN